MNIDELAPEVWAKAPHLRELLAGQSIPAPTGWHVLVLQYIRQQKVGSIIMSDRTRTEDEYQGRVGLVLALGPDAYSDKVKFGSGPWCKPGDWIVWPAVEAATSRFAYGPRVNGERAILTLVSDDRVLATNVDPALAIA